MSSPVLSIPLPSTLQTHSPAPPEQCCAGSLLLVMAGAFGPLNLTPPWNFSCLSPWQASSPPPLFQISLFQISLFTFPPLQTGMGNGKPFPGAGSQGLQTSCKGEAEVGMRGDGASRGVLAPQGRCCSRLGDCLCGLRQLGGDFSSCISQGCSLACLKATRKPRAVS